MTAGSAGRKPLTVTCSLIRVSKDRARKDLGDLSELAESMRTLGLLQPILVRPDGPGWEVVAGHRRLAAAQSLGWDQIFCVSATDLGDAVALLRAERDENTCRKDFTPSEAVALGLRLEELERPKAEERKASTQAKPGEGKVGAGKLPGPETRVRDVVAPAVGMKPRSYEKARQVVKTANDPDETPEVREAAAEAVAEMDATGKVDGPYRKVQAAREHYCLNLERRIRDAVWQCQVLAEAIRPAESPNLRSVK